MLDSIIFYFFAGVAILSAALMVTRRNAIHSAVFLITTLLATAGIFLQLRAEFLFIAQIILYVGGIMVLFVFVIMLVRLDVPLNHITFRFQKWVALFVAMALACEVGVMFWYVRRLPSAGLLTPPAPSRTSCRPTQNNLPKFSLATICCPLKSPASCCW